MTFLFLLAVQDMQCKCGTLFKTRPKKFKRFDFGCLNISKLTETEQTSQALIVIPVMLKMSHLE